MYKVPKQFCNSLILGDLQPFTYFPVQSLYDIMLAADEPPSFLTSSDEPPSFLTSSLVCSGALTTPTPVSIIFFVNFKYFWATIFSFTPVSFKASSIRALISGSVEIKPPPFSDLTANLSKNSSIDDLHS